MKHLKLFFALFAMLALGVGNAWGEEVTYVFTSKDWAAKIGSTAADWTSNKAGAGFSNNGIQVTTNATGANGTSPISYNNISQIVVTYNTNKSKGSGTLDVKIGDNAVTTNNWQYSGSANGTSANFTSTFDYSSPQSGKVTLTANTTTNSIYVVSIKIVTSAGSEPPTPTTQYTIKWHTAKGVTTDVTLNEGATITEPATAPTMTGYEFMGWTASCDVASDGSDFTALTDFGTADSDKDFYAVFAVATTTGGESTATEVTDVLNRATTGITNTSYAEWSGKTATSSAVYAGQSAGGNTSIQLRSSNSNSGIVTTASGGKATKISVEWNLSTSSGRTIDIYGKNSAYTQATDLYNSTNQGTNLGSIKYGTSTELAISGDYEYIGIRSNNGALYLTSVSITWAAEGTSGGTTTYSGYITTCSTQPVVSLPTFTPASGTTFTESLDVTLSAEEGCDIYYTTDGTDPTISSTKYASAINITETKTIKAIANNGTKSSEVATATYTKVEPTGTFELYSGTLVEGDYVIYYEGKAMKAEVTSNRLQYIEVTPNDNKIENPDALAIWHIAPSGSNWTIYNDAQGYAAGNGTKNQAALVTDLAGDNANKAAWTVTTESGTYEFTNVYNTNENVNATLRNNTTYGFACYATGTGGALSLYRKAGTKYNVSVSATTNGTVTTSPTSAEAGTTIALTVTPSTGYVLDALTVTDASSNLIPVTDNKFTMPASDVTVTATFKVNEKPAATLTLSKNGVTEDITGYKQDDIVTLPSITSDCVKEFVGWSANPTCNVAPEYAAGDSYTLAATSQTLYAVYAAVGAGENVTIKHNSTTTTNMSGENDAETFFGLDKSQWSLISAKGGASNHIGVNKDGNLRFYYHADGGSTLTVTAPKTIETVALTFAENKSNAWVKVGGNTITPVDDVYAINATEFVIGNANTSNTQVYLTQIDVTLQGSYSNYSTTCAAALANPTFSLTEGKYTETKSVTISATEGTIYYTLDGTTPTSASTQYTGAIALDECGEHTIKAIAISSDSQSEVVSATYTIKLPLTNSQAAPYTEAEAIAAYDGGCYDNQDVYVKGTVKTATFYASGTYTITLTNGFQFYKFYKDGSKATFTDGEINAGDVLVACGKLSKYNTTYQLAEGCYLVEHEPYTGVKTDISNTEATAYTVDQAFALIADVSSDLAKEVYVKGLVAVAPTSNPTGEGKMTYSISDNGENTGNVLKVYLGLGLGGAEFTSKEDVKLGDYVVAKGLLLDYSGTYEITNSQLVQYIPAATIEVADITMEVGATTTISATVVPVATVTYTIKENAANAITLSGNTITANAVGTATITATVDDGATYMGNSIDFTVTVNAKSTKDKVVILAQYQGQWYAMKAEKGSGSNSLAALPVEYINGKLYNVAETDKASITWERASYDGKATFKNGENYPTGTSTGTALTLGTTACEWTDNGVTYMIGNRTFLYNKGGYFKNYATSNAGGADYSSLPEVVAPVYATADIYTRDVTAGNFGTICLPYGSSNYSGAEFFEVAGKETGKVYLNSVNSLVAGTPYIFQATNNKISVVYEGAVVGTAGSENGLYGTFEKIDDVKAESDGKGYIIALMSDGTCALQLCGDNCWLDPNRAYLIIDDINKTKSPMPGCRRISMDVQGENETTGVDDLFTTDAPVKAIENGQLIIIRDGVKYNVQGQRL